MKSDSAVGSGLRHQQRAFTRDRLIEAFAEMVRQKGYAATTIDDIVGFAGASRATFYLHFHSKREVVIELAARLLPEVQAFYSDLDGVLSDGSRPMMREWMRGAIDWMGRNQPIFLAFGTEQVDSGPASLHEAWALADQMPNYLLRWPEGSQRQARIRIEMLSQHFGTLFSFARRNQNGEDHLSTDEIIDAMTDIWSEALKPPVVSD